MKVRKRKGENDQMTADLIPCPDSSKKIYQSSGYY